MSEVFFNGAERRIEGRYTHSNKENPPIAVILHPHPLYGGTMSNKVIYNMYQCFAEEGFSVLRFNFRGVGRSQGQHDKGVGELIDTGTALDWIQEQNPGSSSCWVAGFSFGAWIALQLLMRRPEIRAFIAVAPPVNIYDFAFLGPCAAHGLFVQGDKDIVVPEKYTADLVNKLSRQRNAHIEYTIVPDADHFFRNKINNLNMIIKDYIRLVTQEIGTSRTKPDKRRRPTLL
jgi:alpha/beta superfamily hydrolase